MTIIRTIRRLITWNGTLHLKHLSGKLQCDLDSLRSYLFALTLRQLGPAQVLLLFLLLPNYVSKEKRIEEREEKKSHISKWFWRCSWGERAEERDNKCCSFSATSSFPFSSIVTPWKQVDASKSVCFFHSLNMVSFEVLRKETIFPPHP